MAKYNEIMEHVEVNEIMRARVLKNVDAHFAKKRRANIRRWTPVVGGLAAAAVLMLLIAPWKKVSNVAPVRPEDSQTQVIFQREEFPSAVELSAACGFTVPDLTELPFAVEETSYGCIGKDLADITYTGAEQSLNFRKAPGIDDISGDYNEYDVVKEVEIEGQKVVLKGDDGTFCLAIWDDGEYSYSIGLANGTALETMEALVAQAMG